MAKKKKKAKTSKAPTTETPSVTCTRSATTGQPVEPPKPVTLREVLWAVALMDRLENLKVDLVKQSQYELAANIRAAREKFLDTPVADLRLEKPTVSGGAWKAYAIDYGGDIVDAVKAVRAAAAKTSS